MGQSLVGPRGCIIKNEDGVAKCVPYTKYKPFSVCNRKAAGELIAEFKALPTAKNTPNDSYWWVNCQFVPNDDNTLMVTSAAYQLRNGQTIVRVGNVPSGKICKFDFQSSRLKCELVSRTGSSTLPKVQVHPDSFFIFYLDSTEIKIFHASENTGINSKAFEPRFKRYRSFALSPDGRRTCILAREGKVNYDLIIFGVNVYGRCDASIHCTKLNKSFRGTLFGSEFVECKWSPDSRQVAVSISTGCLMLVDIKSEDVVCSVFPDIIPDSDLGNVAAFDFDPRSCHQIMAVGDDNGYLYILNVEDKEIICQSRCFENRRVDSIVYTQEGSLLSVALHNFTIHLCDSSNCDVILTVNMVDSCPDLGHLTSVGEYPYITSMNFNRSGEQLVTCCSDGLIRMWQMPTQLSLKYQCKLRLLSLLCQGDIKSLPLPSALKDYLLPLPS